MNKKYKETVEQFEKVTGFFAEDPKKVLPEDFFGILRKFVQIMKVRTLQANTSLTRIVTKDAVKELEEAKIEEEKATKRKDAKARRVSLHHSN